jgi:Abortive infection alpha
LIPTIDRKAEPVSDSLIPITDEQAKLGQEILKALHGLGSFVKTALGSTPEDLVGYYLGDRLHIRRVENMVRMLYEARARLVDMGKNETQPAPLSLALPILQGAAEEEREELVDLWARLFASAMDPATRNNVRHAFIAASRKWTRLTQGSCVTFTLRSWVVSGAAPAAVLGMPV